MRKPANLAPDAVESSMRDRAEAARDSEADQPGSQPGRESEALEENVELIKGWEEAALHRRSGAERLSDWITRTVAGGPVLVFHVLWFGAWSLVNVGIIPGIRPFDPFPFPLLTTTVSLEAIFLSLFVIASQNRLAHQSDQRAHLDLQIDLLAEREMTIVLRLLQDIARHLEVATTVTPDQIRDLVKKTDIHELTNKVDEIPEPGLEHDHDKGDR